MQSKLFTYLLGVVVADVHAPFVGVAAHEGGAVALESPVEPVDEDGDGEEEERAGEEGDEVLEADLEENVFADEEPDGEAKRVQGDGPVRVLAGREEDGESEEGEDEAEEDAAGALQLFRRPQVRVQQLQGEEDEERH